MTKSTISCVGLVYVWFIWGSSTAQDKIAPRNLLQAGPMVGHVDMVEAWIWVQTKAPATVKIEYWTKNHAPLFTEAVKTETRSFLIAKHLLTDLALGAVYQYRVHINGHPISLPYPLTFTTQTLWQWRREPPAVRFAIGSCFYVNDPLFDRSNPPYGGDHHILAAIYEAKPDFMVWLGDNVYYREFETGSINRMNYRFRHTRSFPGLQPLLAAFPHYAIWDDHDFGPNNSDRSYPFKHDALTLFKAYWANPHFGLKDTPGVFGKMSWADLDFFFLDDRFHRAPNRLKDPEKAYLGEAQLQWLKDNLIYSNATFKFVVLGNQCLNKYSPHEGYANYIHEHHRFMNWLAQAGVDGVVFLSGDRHFTELLKLERPGNYPLYEFTCSPLTSGTPSELENENQNPLRVPSTLILNARSFGIIQVTGTRSQRLLTLQAFDALGEKRWERILHREEVSRAFVEGHD